ncbi:hypothetical protein, variant 1 [Aphanomyces invadans]|uniref:Band 7 domain-containing protein n=1 Tax=Aphanomyces invadans TaxID=157072 RepID=A0A024UKQ4_9STRA|nr:hypothetical protein, variant 1 [Aphanomyces invadans]ETW06213.1 hypothetical protein, variant 1 [Aphanomyces invadans]|eukprot:XP_008864288.1 hypothetical protein, variant 1 [Aphanomyces invadans]
MSTLTRSTRIVSFKTTVVHDVPCGTASGVLIRFHQVEIVHRLRSAFVLDTVRNYSMRFEKLWIEDVTYHEINLLCSKFSLDQVYISHFDQLDELLQARMSALLAVWAPGLDIISIRLTKPHVPEALRDTYELVDQEKAKLLLATQAQRNVLKQAETDFRTAVLASEKAAALSLIHMEKLHEQVLASQHISRIQDQMTVSRAKETADATFYKATLETKSFLAKLTPAYLAYLRATAGQTNIRYYFGANIPQGFVDSAADVVGVSDALPVPGRRDGH